STPTSSQSPYPPRSKPSSIPSTSRDPRPSSRSTARITPSTRSSGSSGRQAKASPSRSGRTPPGVRITDDLLDGALKHRELERLSQDIKPTVGRLSRIGETAGQKNRQVGKLLAADLRQAKAVHRARHDDVRKQQVEFDALLKVTQCLGSIFCPHHAVSELLKQRGCHVGDIAAVFHDKHSALNVVTCRRTTRPRFRRHFYVRSREIDGHNGAAIGPACDCDRSSGLVGEPAPLRKPEPGALADRLRRVERLEHPLQHVLWNSGSGIDNGQRDKVSFERAGGRTWGEND